MIYSFIAGIVFAVIILLLLTRWLKRVKNESQKYRGVSVKKTTGNLGALPVNEARLVCEHAGCFEQNVKEYERKPDGRDWEGQPISICDKHCQGFTPIVKFQGLINKYPAVKKNGN